MKQAIALVLMICVTLCLITAVGCMFGGPILLAYKLATIWGLIYTIGACIVTATVAMAVITHIE